VYLIAGLAPSLIWLLFYLSKDKHPEPKRTIIKVFCLGILVAGIVYVLSIFLLKGIAVFFPNISFNNVWFVIFRYFIIVGLIEELAKYLIARDFVTSSPDIDEPVDIMLYLVVSALGFAALENILLIFNHIGPVSIREILNFVFIRLIGATFLHTLASGTLGFFVALSFYQMKYRKRIFFVGLFIAVFFHGFYDFVIVYLKNSQQVLNEVLVLTLLAIFTTWGFVKLKKIKSVGKVSNDKNLT
jgi:RsiW-degrading membrane proteinase PrsW (M82 family)